MRLLSLRSEFEIVLEAERGSPEPTRWGLRRLTAAESWELADSAFTLGAGLRVGRREAGGEDGDMRLLAGTRERYILARCVLRVTGAIDPDTGAELAYPGPHGSPERLAQWWDRVPTDVRAELALAVTQASQLTPEAVGNSAASPPSSPGGEA